MVKMNKQIDDMLGRDGGTAPPTMEALRWYVIDGCGANDGGRIKLIVDGDGCSTVTAVPTPRTAGATCSNEQLPAAEETHVSTTRVGVEP